jgi:protease-4
MVALAADRVFARESSLTGSIGVLFQSAEFSKLLEKAGITPLSVTSGPYKDEPSPFRPLTEGGRRVLQEMVNESHRWFVGLVADRRKLPSERVAKIADGRVYSGRTALDLGLVDALGGEREAREWLAQAHGIAADLPVQDVPTQPPSGMLRDALGQLVQKTFLSERLTLDGLISLWHPE